MWVENTCIHQSGRCDGAENCMFGEDEINCSDAYNNLQNDGESILSVLI